MTLFLPTLKKLLKPTLGNTSRRTPTTPQHSYRNVPPELRLRHQARHSTKNPTQQARFRVLATTNAPPPMSNLALREHQPNLHGERVPVPPIPHRRVIRTRHRPPPQARLRHLLVGKKRILRFVVWIPHQVLASRKASPRRTH